MLFDSLKYFFYFETKTSTKPGVFIFFNEKFILKLISLMSNFYDICVGFTYLLI